MQLNIIGIDQKEQLEVQWVELQTVVGNFVIQPGHAPMVVELQAKTQVRFCRNSGKQDASKYVSGIAHITRTSVTVLIDSNL